MEIPEEIIHRINGLGHELKKKKKRKKKRGKKTRPIAKILLSHPRRFERGVSFILFLPEEEKEETREEKPVEINDLEILIQWQGCGVAASCLATSCLWLSSFSPFFLAAFFVNVKKKEEKLKKLRFFVRRDEEVNLCSPTIIRSTLITTLFVHRHIP